MSGTPLLEIRDLRVGFPTRRGIALATNHVDLTLAPHETLGLVGESGSGKSVTCRSILGMVPYPGAIVGGQILLDGEDLVTAVPARLRHIRAHRVGMIFQDPASCLNPVFTVGHQLVETLRCTGMDRGSARARSIELLDRVGLPAPDVRMRAYPHQLSGGQRQRVMIALALAGNPALLLADEPTTALDVTIQDQVLRLLDEIRRETGLAMIIVSHDMGVIGQLADRVAVMYAGSIVEVADAATLFARPRHPYTQGLLTSMPRLEADRRAEQLATIRGQPPDLAALPDGCPFAPRCPEVREACDVVTMALLPVGDGHLTACPFHEGRP